MKHPPNEEVDPVIRVRVGQEDIDHQDVVEVETLWGETWEKWPNTEYSEDYNAPLFGSFSK